MTHRESSNPVIKINRIWCIAYSIWIILSLIYTWYLYAGKSDYSGYLPTFILFTVLSVVLLILIRSVKIRYFLIGLCTGILAASFFFETHLLPFLVIMIIARLCVILLMLIIYIPGEKHFRVIMDYILVILISIFIAEIMLGLTDYIFEFDILKDKKELAVLSPGNRINGETLNRFAYLGNEPDIETEKDKWLFIGDSFGFGSVDYDSNFIKISGDRFNVTTVNVSWPGFSPRDYLKQLDRFVNMNDFTRVFIVIFTGNDILEMKKDNTVQYNRFHYKNSNIYRLIRNIMLLYKFRMFVENNMHFSQENYTELERRRLLGNKNATEDMWDDFRETIEMIIERAEAESLSVHFIVIPDEYTINKELREDIIEEIGERNPNFMYSHNRTIRMLKNINADFIDMHPVLDSLNRAGQRVYIRNNTHINERGNTAIVDALEEQLLE